MSQADRPISQASHKPDDSRNEVTQQTIEGLWTKLHNSESPSVKEEVAFQLADYYYENGQWEKVIEALFSDSFNLLKYSREVKGVFEEEGRDLTELMEMDAYKKYRRILADAMLEVASSVIAAKKPTDDELKKAEILCLQAADADKPRRGLALQYIENIHQLRSGRGKQH